MVAVADGLEEKGFAVRERSPADRRAYVLRVTGPGRRAVTRAGRSMERAADEFLAPLSLRQRRELKRMLRRLASP
jgi:DNA-binding MarR family transcriptional regulator